MRTTAISLFVLALAISSCVFARGEDDVSVAVTDSKDDAVDFINDVMPLLDRLGCSQCHAAGGGKGGLKLSMFGGQPEDDHTTLTKLRGGRRIDKIEPTKSLLLLKATESIPHEGGQKIKVDSPEYGMLLSWIARGAPWRDENAPRLVSVKVSPEEHILKKDETATLQVSAVFSDGTEKDVTRLASYESLDENVAVVDQDGKVKTNDYGESPVAVIYMRRSDIARIVVPQPLPTPFPKLEANNKIDEFVHAKLKTLGIPPSGLCEDHEFLRRVYLDLIGALPTADEARAYLADTDPEKRSKLIERLFERGEYSDFWALKWGDLFRIKGEMPVNVWPNAAQAYQRWLKGEVAKNTPYDEFARELLAATGSNFRNPEVNFYRALSTKAPQDMAEMAAVIFMGMRIGCARCHGHPSENWGPERNVELAAFFGNVAYKRTKEWKEEIVLFDPKAVFNHPITGQVVTLPESMAGRPIKLAEGEDPRMAFSRWLTSPENPDFARCIVNRVWFWLMGRGIIHQPDDIRPSNPPENPELLEYLQNELVGHDYDLRHIFRLILNSRTYQLSSQYNKWNEKDVAHFSHYRTRRLAAEQFSDAISQVTGTWEAYKSIIPEPYTHIPPGQKACRLADGNISSSFLDLFGKPSRDAPLESDRNSETSVWQALYLFSSDTFESGLTNFMSGQRIQKLLTAGKDDSAIIDEIFLATLSRFPNEKEKETITQHIPKGGKGREDALQDVVWAVMNTKEFMLNH